MRETGLNISSLLVELDRLEQDCDELHRERMKSVHRLHLDSYREERHRQLLNVKTVMEQEHQECLRLHVTRESLRLQERQRAFKEEFERDMQSYRQTGQFLVRDTADAVVQNSQNTSIETLDSFVPEKDSDFSGFLGSERTNSVVSTNSERTNSIVSTKSNEEIQLSKEV